MRGHSKNRAPNRYLPQSLTLLLILLHFTTFSFGENMHIEVIQTSHQPAAQLVEPIKSVLHPSGTVKAFKNQLIVKTTRGNHAEIQLLLDELDKKPQAVVIQVKQGSLGNDSNFNVVTEGDFPIGSRGKIVLNNEGEPTVRVKKYSTNKNDKGTLRVNGTEGYPAYIAVGQVLPFLSSTFDNVHGYSGSALEFKDVKKGFYATPYLRADNTVVVEISATNDSLSQTHGGGLDTKSVATRVRGKLGQWIPLGGSGSVESVNSSGLLSKSYRTKSKSMDWQIKVTLSQ